jgi:uncharacterized membrane protein
MGTWSSCCSRWQSAGNQLTYQRAEEEEREKSEGQRKEHDDENERTTVVHSYLCFYASILILLVLFLLLLFTMSSLSFPLLMSFSLILCLDSFLALLSHCPRRGTASGREEISYESERE